MLACAAFALPVHVGAASAQAQASVAPTDARRAEVAAFEQRFEAALAARDGAWLARAVDPTFSFTHSTGSVDTLDSLLARAGPARRTVVPGSQRVELHGDIALTRSATFVEQLTPGRATAYTITYIRVYRRGRDGWRMLSHVSTALTPGKPGS